MPSLSQLAIAAIAVLQGVLAVPASEPTTLPGHYVCTSLTTITSTVAPVGNCLRQVCLPPTRTCSPGEPSKSPFPTVTTTVPRCTVEVLVEERCGCASCVPTPTPTP
ncbi:hypothetical protein F4821DRAFT_63358 [Hypoxylon rubiginosum]|uniref:Uncharacterized protein n=1 Tax=Hypoxylon rubiginosum TaxID=110542 RepID=A0ACC0D9W6_9PEZI|nr:hypothetical protein F4821DRAFT_63358 [Hypoxylon rubiginosum]